ncbi:MAG: TetR/AcrR family transcriptional regulator [Lachnospiraceae bacterium]|nr:TetR/AcrR family transcriptional regulator [Lachnospiraceae bacterium]
MAARNNERRESILAVAYSLFGEKAYEEVPLSDIARGVGITKSLLQHYFPQKIDIIKTMIIELLETSSAYIGDLGLEDKEVFQSISDLNMLFFKGVSANYKLRSFMLCSVQDASCLDVWVESICSWLRHYCSEDTFTYRQLKTALCFAMGGTMHLFLHQNELDIDYRRYCRIHMQAILHMLDYPPENIIRILKITDEHISKADADSFLSYCEKTVSWMTL